MDGEEFDYSGHSVSLSSDGITVAIGAPKETFQGQNCTYSGCVRVYQFVDDAWVQLGSDIVEQIDPAYLRKQPLPALLRVPSVVARNLVSTAA